MACCCRRAGGLTRRGTSYVSSSIARVRHREAFKQLDECQSGVAAGCNFAPQQQQQQRGFRSAWTEGGGSGRATEFWWVRSSVLNSTSASAALLKSGGGAPRFARGYASEDLPPHQEIGMPSLSPTMTQGNIVGWKKKEGDQVAAGDVLCEIETDKATLEMEAMEEGFLAKIVAGDGSKDIQVGQAICIIVESKDDIGKFSNFEAAAKPASPPPKQEAAPPPPPPKTESAPPPPPAPRPASSKPSSPPPPPSGDRIFASPLAKKIASEKNVPLSRVRGTGPDGRILKADIDDYLASGPSSAKEEAPASTGETAEPDEEIEMVAARRYLQSKQTIPHYYLSLDTRVDKILELQEQLNKSQGNAKGKQLSINDFVIKAAALATRKVPECNSSWTDDFIRQYNNVNICVAIQSGKESLVPVLKDVDRKGLSAISQEVDDFVEKGKAKSLKASDCEGGTFTVSLGGGPAGVKQFSAIINPPQSCILAVGKPEQRVLPGPQAGEFEVGSIVTVTLSCDHRVVDGAIGALWLGAFKGYIEEPLTLLL